MCNRFGNECQASRSGQVPAPRPPPMERGPVSTCPPLVLAQEGECFHPQCAHMKKAPPNNVPGLSNRAWTDAVTGTIQCAGPSHESTSRGSIGTNKRREDNSGFIKTKVKDARDPPLRALTCGCGFGCGYEWERDSCVRAQRALVTKRSSFF